MRFNCPQPEGVADYGTAPLACLGSVDSYGADVTLSDGRKVSTSDIAWDRNTYHFTVNGEDVTNLLKQADKAANYPGFDRAKDNLRAYNEAYQRRTGQVPQPTGSTSTLYNFAQQILTDPISAPLESLDRTVEQAKKSTGIQTIATIAGIGLVIWAYRTITGK